MSLIYRRPLVHFRSERFCGASIAQIRLVPSALGGCPVSVQLWYPAEPGSGDRTRAVSSGGRGLAFGRALGSYRRNAERRALVNTARGIPCLCHLPGLGRLARREHQFVQDLASRGFIVAGIGL